MEEYYTHSPKHIYREFNNHSKNHEFNQKLKELINNDSKDNKINNKNYGIFESKEDAFPRDRKSNEYKKINLTRTKLLKLIDKEVIKYSKHKTMINSKTTPNYIKSFFNNYRINLKTIQIKSSIESGVSFGSTDIHPYIKKFIDLDLHPYIFKCNNHYHKFKRKKKIVLSKQSKNLKLESTFNDSSSPISPISENDLSPNRERHLYMITGKISTRNYFDYLHSLFYTLHKEFYTGKVVEMQKYASANLYNFTTHLQNFKEKFSRKSLPDIIKKDNTNNNFNNDNINSDNNNDSNSKKIKKSSSNDKILTSTIIHLVECEPK